MVTTAILTDELLFTVSSHHHHHQHQDDQHQQQQIEVSNGEGVEVQFSVCCTAPRQFVLCSKGEVAPGTRRGIRVSLSPKVAAEKLPCTHHFRVTVRDPQSAKVLCARTIPCRLLPPPPPTPDFCDSLATQKVPPPLGGSTTATTQIHRHGVTCLTKSTPSTSAANGSRQKSSSSSVSSFFNDDQQSVSTTTTTTSSSVEQSLTPRGSCGFNPQGRFHSTLNKGATATISATIAHDGGSGYTLERRGRLSSCVVPVMLGAGVVLLLQLTCHMVFHTSSFSPASFTLAGYWQNPQNWLIWAAFCVGVTCALVASKLPLH